MKTIIIGAGGTSRSLAREFASQIELIGFLDDKLSGQEIDGFPVLGPLSAILYYEDCSVLIGIGNPSNSDLRNKIAARLNLPPERYDTIVQPNSYVSPGARIETGSVVRAFVVVETDVAVGQHVHMSSHTVIGAGSRIGSGSLFSNSITLGGRNEIGAGCYFGNRCMIDEGCSIGDGALIGMGAAVFEDIPPMAVVVGNPARIIRFRDTHKVRRNGPE